MSLYRGASKLYMVEPSKTLLQQALYNCARYTFNKTTQIIYPINFAISNNTEFNRSFEFLNFNSDCITFNNLINQYDINYIDFLKIDCEGGEYSIFIQENLKFLLNNVTHFAVEFHLRYDNCRNNFINFRNNILIHFPNWEARSCISNTICPGKFVDLKPFLYHDKFVNEYNCEFMIYIGKYCTPINT